MWQVVDILKVPSEFEIHYAYQGQLNNYLNKISRCVLTGCEVNYGGEEFTTFRQFDNDGAVCTNNNDIIIYRDRDNDKRNYSTRLLIWHNILKHFRSYYTT